MAGKITKDKKETPFLIPDAYPEREVPRENFFVIPHGKIPNTIVNKAIVTFNYDASTGKDTITADGLTLFRDHKAIGANEIGIGPHKLLVKGMSEFLKKNNINPSKDEQAVFLLAEFPLEEYLLSCRHANKKGREVTKQERDNFRRKMHTYLDRLFELHIKDNKYADLRILSKIDIRRGKIQMEFSLSFAQVLIQYPLTTLPQQIYQIDDQHAVAYQIAMKLYGYSGIDNNIVNETSRTISIKSILNGTSIPEISFIREKRYSWEQTIKDPFLQAIAYLLQQGVLKDYEFNKANGEKITSDEINAGYFDSYETFADTVFKFTMDITEYHNNRVKNKLALLKKLEKKKQNS